MTGRSVRVRTGPGDLVRISGYRRRKIAPGVTVYKAKRPGSGRYDTEEPWICWWFLSTDRETRITGRMRVLVECAVCGQREKLRLRIPRFGPVNPSGREHPARTRFKLAHLHPDKPHAFAWARPLLNLAAHKGGVDLDLLKMRLEADLREAQE